MITVYPVLRQHIVENRITIKELAAVAGIGRFPLLLSLFGLRKWKLPEAVRLCCFFQTPDAEKLFYKNIINHNKWKVKRIFRKV